MCNFKTLKIQKKIKIALEFQSFKCFLPHLNGLQCTWCMKKNYNVEYNKT
jgi:hypothetical protein